MNPDFIETASQAKLNHALQQAQAELAEREQFMHAIADNAPGLLGFWDSELHCTFANQGYLDWFGLNREQLYGMTMQSLQGEALFRLNEPFVRAALRGENQQFERQVARPNGTLAHVWVQYMAHRVNGQVQGFFALVTDITEIKQREEQSLLADAQNAALIRAIPDLIFTLSRDGTYLAVHARDEDALYVSPEQLLGRNMFDIFPADMARQFATAIVAALDSGQMQVCEYILEIAGEARRFESRIVPCTLQSVISIVRDVTAQHQAQLALQKALAGQQALLKEVHHRVKNNLQIISSLLRLESHRGVNEAARGVLGDMQSRIRSMSLLHEALYRSGEFGTVDLGDYLRQLCSQAFRLQLAEPSAIQLTLDLESIPIGMDQATPCGLLVNELLSNSLKHAFPGQIKVGQIQLQLQRTGQAGEVLLIVSDSGVGLPVDLETRRNKSLGLQLVSDLAGQLGGTLEVQSGPGARFALRFPVLGQ
jgi:PAS domain S-box-containing protein